MHFPPDIEAVGAGNKKKKRQKKNSAYTTPEARIKRKASQRIPDNNLTPAGKLCIDVFG